MPRRSTGDQPVAPTALKERITGLRHLLATDLHPHPHNWRQHPAQQRSVLRGLLQTVGIADALLVYDSPQHGGMTIIDGHLRQELSPTQAWPCLVLDVTDAEADLLLATLDPMVGLADTNGIQLKALLETLRVEDAALRTWLMEMAASVDAALPGPVGIQPGDDEAPVDRAEELREKWGVELEQCWQLGVHRVVCGDCTDKAVVEQVMHKEQADLVCTDPPYNVAIVGGTHDPRDTKNYGTGPHIQNDNMSDPDFDGFLRAAFQSMSATMRPGAVYYLCAPSGSNAAQFLRLLDQVLPLRESLVWVKQQAVFSRHDYHWQHESIFYGWKDGAGHYFIDDHTQTTLWHFDRPHYSGKEHPTQKPVDLLARAIQNSSQPHWLVYDPFLGSGTTLIACERLGRVCRGIEIDPGYVAVTLERWATITGQTPQLIT